MVRDPSGPINQNQLSIVAVRVLPQQGVERRGRRLAAGHEVEPAGAQPRVSDVLAGDGADPGPGEGAARRHGHGRRGDGNAEHARFRAARGDRKGHGR
jgi:hypothetical protein